MDLECQRQTDNHACAVTGTGAVRFDRSAMQLDKIVHDRQTETESLPGRRGGSVCLPKWLKNLRQRRGVNADPCVDDLDPDILIPAVHRDRDTPPRWSEFDRIGNQIAKQLLQANSVTVDLYVVRG